MMSRYREVADIVITYLEHKDRLVRLSITSLLPRIAHFLRDRFVTNYLNVSFAPFFTVQFIFLQFTTAILSLRELLFFYRYA